MVQSALELHRQLLQLLETLLLGWVIINELFAPVIKGSYLADYEQLLKLAFSRASFNTGAKMAVDLAFHDLLAKQQGTSVAKYLGAKTNVLETDVSISCGSIKDTITNIRDGVELGFNAIKVKTGADFTRDIELLKHIEKNFQQQPSFALMQIKAGLRCRLDNLSKSLISTISILS